MESVLISIVTYKSRNFIEDCLRTLSNQTYPKENYRIVISDNNTADGTLDFVRQNYPAIEIIENRKNLGFAGGHNRVFEKAVAEGYDYVIVVNDDILVAPDWLEHLAATAKSDSRIGSVQSKILLWPEQDKINSCGNLLHYLGFGFTSRYRQPDRHGLCSDREEIAYGSGCGVLYRVALIRQLGGFYEEFFAYHEDTEMGWRLRLAGYKNILSAKSVMYHKYEFSRGKQKFYWIERNRWLLLWYHYSIWSLLCVLPMAMLTEAGLVISAIRNQWWREKLRSMAYFLKPSVWRQ
ncbi:MAG: glycosyltransferase family 2 protein, partial [Parcubacteria group bacterium]|nr:glycosyltransferase family 2 protein [Parcubacteria group bacterium]